MPLSGGASRQLLACSRRWFFVSPHGIYYAACGDAEPSIRLIEAATGNDRAITTLVDPVFGDPAGLAISPDGIGIVLRPTWPRQAEPVLDRRVGQHRTIGRAEHALRAVGPDIDAEQQIAGHETLLSLAASLARIIPATERAGS